MEFIDILKDRKKFKEVKKLYLSAFPKEELIPLFFLKKTAKTGDADFFALYEGSLFVGLFYLVHRDGLMYVFFFAIHESLRGKGYGSKALGELQKQFSDYRMILAIEEITEDCPNYAQRVKRKAFYLANGFQESRIKITENGVCYDMLTFGGEVHLKEYTKLMKDVFGERLYQKYLSGRDVEFED